MTVCVPEIVPFSDLESLSCLLNDSTKPLSLRFRALFSLKAINSKNSIHQIAKAFSDESNLLKHEVAYVLGQMKNTEALPVLYNVLSDKSQDGMVRHEAAEAIGAIGEKESVAVLQQYLDDDLQVVRETVQLAIDGLLYQGTENLDDKKFNSIDPAPPSKSNCTTEELTERLLDTKLSLFERYRSMFALRNRGDVGAVEGLAKGFDDDSALFRHEIAAYVFGQMQHPASVPSLIKVLSNTFEVNMVRHEAAEALGSIATPECFPILKQYSMDEDKTVRDSCIVGLDMFAFENSSALI